MSHSQFVDVLTDFDGMELKTTGTSTLLDDVKEHTSHYM
jgi:hypothetical protein